VLRAWSKLPPDVAADLIPDDYMLVFPAHSGVGGGLDLDRVVARERVQQFIADTAYVQAERLVKHGGGGGSERSIQSLLKSAVGKYVERPGVALYRQHLTRVAPPLHPNMPWD